MMNKQTQFRRRGAALVAVAVASTVLVGFAALAIDMGMLYGARTEIQRSADAGALAGVTSMLSETRLKGATGLNTVLNASRQASSSFANRNKVFGLSPSVDQNADVTMGRLSNPQDPVQQLDCTVSASKYNAVKVTVHRDTTRNGPVPLMFAQVFGFASKNMSASATAIVDDGVSGFATPPGGGNVMLMPIAVDVSTWAAFVAGTLYYSANSGDGWTYSPQNQTVSSGSDGVKELNIWPGGGGNQGGAGNGGGSLQLTPGNWGTVNIGVTNNSTSTLGAQIRYGITPEQMAMYPNSQLTLGADGTLNLGGNPGMSNGIKDDLIAIIGQTRTIPLYSNVSGNGNNTVFTIVGFAGVRIMDVSLTGNPGSRYVLCQPAVSMDPGARTGGTSGQNYNVYRPPQLAR